MNAPCTHGNAACVEVQGLIVRASHTGEVSRHVVDDRLYHVRRSELVFVEMRNEAASQIVQHPRGHWVLDASGFRAIAMRASSSDLAFDHPLKPPAPRPKTNSRSPRLMFRRISSA